MFTGFVVVYVYFINVLFIAHVLVFVSPKQSWLQTRHSVRFTTILGSSSFQRLCYMVKPACDVGLGCVCLKSGLFGSFYVDAILSIKQSVLISIRRRMEPVSAARLPLSMVLILKTAAVCVSVVCLLCTVRHQKGNDNNLLTQRTLDQYIISGGSLTYQCHDILYFITSVI